MNTEFQRSESELSQKLVIDNHTNVREELEIEATIEEYLNFIEERNINGVLSIFAEDAMTFDLLPPMQNHGIEELRSRLESWFSSFKGDIKLEVEQLRIRAEKDTGFAHCLIRYRGEKEDMYNRVTMGFEKIGHDWLIAHLHASLPMDMKS